MVGKKYIDYVADFETTVYQNQTDTQVWCAGFCELNTDSEDVEIVGCIEDFLDYFKKLRKNCRIFFHNLKFDCAFIADYLMRHNQFKNAVVGKYDEENNIDERRLKKTRELQHGEFNYLISEMGQWYELTLNWRGSLIKFVDSYKLLPRRLADIGESFGTKHQKSSIVYEGFRYPNCDITDNERDYIKNDVLVLKESLKIFYGKGHRKLTIASCCMEYFKKVFGEEDFKEAFPNIYKLEIDSDLYGAPNIGEYIHKSYHGGWCYVNEKIRNKIVRGGYTLDVNSLYSSVMHSKSGNRYPVGHPIFFKGKIPYECFSDDFIYFVRVRCNFKLKENKLPFIQIKGTLDYRGNEMLKTSDVYSRKTGEYKHFNSDGTLHTVELTLTEMDLELFLEHYECEYFEILDGCYFHSEIGLFDEYIDHFYGIKSDSNGAEKAIAKLFLNGLYGRFAMYIDSSYKIMYINDDDQLCLKTIHEEDKTPGYIPVGSCITSYARCFEIRAAQANYENFLYSDTDSIHLMGSPSNAKGVTIDSKNLCCWKNEGEWDYGIFSRQKGYIEVKDGKLNVKCAGMHDNCKNLIQLAYDYSHGKLSKREVNANEKLDKIEKAFVLGGFELTDFKVGFQIYGNLKQKRIYGGIVLKKDWFKLRLTVRNI